MVLFIVVLLIFLNKLSYCYLEYLFFFSNTCFCWTVSNELVVLLTSNTPIYLYYILTIFFNVFDFLFLNIVCIILSIFHSLPFSSIMCSRNPETRCLNSCCCCFSSDLLRWMWLVGPAAAGRVWHVSPTSHYRKFRRCTQTQRSFTENCGTHQHTWTWTWSCSRPWTRTPPAWTAVRDRRQKTARTRGQTLFL